MTHAEAVLACERAYFLELLGRLNWHVTKAAREAGLTRQHFYKVLKRCDIELPVRQGGYPVLEMRSRRPSVPRRNYG